MAAARGGVLRVEGTRVTLESIVHGFELGATPEEIVDRFPSLDIDSVYEVIAYVLRNGPAVDESLTERGEQAAALQAEIEARWPADGLRARLLPRAASRP